MEEEETTTQHSTAQKLAEYVSKSTLDCAISNGCVSCLYKILPNGEKSLHQVGIIELEEIILPRNVRPECCPRSWNNSQIVNKQHSDSPRYFGLYDYSEESKILTLGDGDFSFSNAIANHFYEGHQNPLTYFTATSFDSYEILLSTYAQYNVREKIENLIARGVTVQHSVDATNLQLSIPTNSLFGKIIWNFPCVKVVRGADGQVTELEENIRMMRKFFSNIKDFMSPGGEVHITHKTVEPFSWWNITQLAAEHGLECILAVHFDRCNYPGYTNRKALDRKSFPCFDAKTFIFMRAEDLLNYKKKALSFYEKRKKLLPYKLVRDKLYIYLASCWQVSRSDGEKSTKSSKNKSKKRTCEHQASRSDGDMPNRIKAARIESTPHYHSL